MVTLENVSYEYPNGSLRLRDFNLHIEKGEFVFVIGPNGSGKSTLLRLLTKELDPQSGRIFINGTDTTTLRRKEIPLLRRKIGVVFQDFRLLANKSVYDNVAFAMLVTGAHTRAIRRTVPSVLAMVNLHKKAKSMPNQLSGGEKQRTALARAMVNNPPILIADEPTGNLDPEIAWEIMHILEEINKRGTTVIVVTHSEDIVNKMQKRVIALRQGKIVSDRRGGYVL